MVNEWIKILIAPVVVGLVVGILSVIGTLYYERILNKERIISDVKLSQYGETIDALWELEFYLTELMGKYNIPTGKENTLAQKWSEDELGKINEFVLRVNKGFSKIFVFLPDEEYLNVSDIIDPSSPKALKAMKEELMLAMRQTQIPNTKIKIKDIKFLHKL